MHWVLSQVCFCVVSNKTGPRAGELLMRFLNKQGTWVLICDTYLKSKAHPCMSPSAEKADASSYNIHIGKPQGQGENMFKK